MERTVPLLTLMILTLLSVSLAIGTTTTSSLFQTSFELPYATQNETILSFTSPDAPLPQEPPHPEHQNPLNPIQLVRRQSNGCAQGYNSCANEGQQGAGLCCPPTAACSVDGSGHVGCCPYGALCTGVVSQQQSPGATPTSSTTGAVGGAAGPPSTSAAVTAQGGPTVIISGGQPGATEGSSGGGGAVFGASGSSASSIHLLQDMKMIFGGILGAVGLLGWQVW